MEHRAMSNELENHLINRALRDDNFHALLCTNPRAAIEAEIARLGLRLRLPEGLDVKVLEETPNTLYLVLPPRTTGSVPR